MVGVIPSRARIAASFGLKADRYAANATVQIALLKRIAPLIGTFEPSRELWADMGCGIGLLARVISDQGRCAPDFVGIDLAERAAARAAAAYQLVVVADVESDPFKSNRFDGVALSSVLQWVRRPARVLEAARTLLRENGRAVLGVYLEGSFAEVTSAREDLGLGAIGWYPSLAELTQLMGRAGMKISSVAEETSTVWFNGAKEALKSISAVGAGASDSALLTRTMLARLCAAYEKRSRTAQGIPLTAKAAIIEAVAR